MSGLEKILLPVGIGVGAAMVVLTSYVAHKLNKFAKRLNTSVSDLEEVTVKDIQKAVVQEAVEKAARNTVADYMHDVNRVVLADADRELRLEASKAIGAVKKDIQDKVTDILSEEASKIDMDEFRGEVRKKAEKKVLSKFGDNLQDITDKYGQSLSNVSRIYNTVANDIRKAVVKDDDGKVRFTLG